MADQLIPRREMQFQLYEVLDTAGLCSRTRFNEHNVETFNAVIDMAEKMAEEKFLPHNATADKNEPTFDGTKVSMIDEQAKNTRINDSEDERVKETPDWQKRFDKDLKPLQKMPEFLIDAEDLKARMEAVANQAKAQN